MSTSFNALQELLAGKTRRKLANNTYAVQHDDVIDVLLHSTAIVVFYDDGRVSLDSGTWRTTVTKSRINEFGPSGVRIDSVKGEWRVLVNGVSFPYADGFTLTPDSHGVLHPVPGTFPDTVQEERIASAKKRLAEDIKAFHLAAQPTLERWQRSLKETGALDTGGDCFYCKGIVTDLDGGEVTDNSHIWQHLRERYVFPTLYLNAFKAKGFSHPKTSLAAFLSYGHWDDIARILTGYFKKTLGSSTDAPPTAEEARLERYVGLAKDALERPGDFGYFGADETLWSTSAPTWTKHRDSTNDDIANFRVVWSALTSEFPDLVPDSVDADGYPGRDFCPDAPGAIYVFGAGHWAVGHIDQIVVPVYADPAKPLGADNLHPAFIRICGFLDAVRDYPVLDGAESIVEELEAEDRLRAARQYLGDDRSEEDCHKVLAVLLQDERFNEEHDALWNADSEDWYRAAVAAEVDPGDYLTSRHADEADDAEAPASDEGQGTLL